MGNLCSNQSQLPPALPAVVDFERTIVRINAIIGVVGSQHNDKIALAMLL